MNNLEIVKIIKDYLIEFDYQVDISNIKEIKEIYNIISKQKNKYDLLDEYNEQVNKCKCDLLLFEVNEIRPKCQVKYYTEELENLEKERKTLYGRIKNYFDKTYYDKEISIIKLFLSLNQSSLDFINKSKKLTQQELKRIPKNNKIKCDIKKSVIKFISG